MTFRLKSTANSRSSPDSMTTEKRELNPSDMVSSAVYKVITGCVVPRPIGFVSTVSIDGIYNAAPFSFFNAISHIPPMVCISISPIYRTKSKKDTLQNILDTGEFVVNIVNRQLAAAQDFCSNEYPPEFDELTASGLTAAPSSMVKAPRIHESPANFECKLYTATPLPDSPYTLVIGKVVNMHVRGDLLLPDGRISSPKLDAIGRMAGSLYTRTTELFSLDHDAFKLIKAADTPLDSAN